jgi:hypothetical protein
MYKISDVLVDKKFLIKRFHKNQFITAYTYDTFNENYKQIQHRLYKLGYDLKVDGDFSRLNMVDALFAYNRDVYKIVYDYEGITYYTLYKLLFNLNKKVEIEESNYNIESYCNYSFLTSRNDYEMDYNVRLNNRNKIFFLNPTDEFGIMIIQGLIKILNYYKTNYIDVKQTNFKESQNDRVNRILDYVDRNKGITPIVLNVGSSIDYNSKTTLLRGINVFNNLGVINDNHKLITSYTKYVTRSLNFRLKNYFEYLLHEQNNVLPLLKNFNDIASIQIELGYSNNPIDSILQKDPNVIKYMINSLALSIHKMINYKDAKRYTELDDNLINTI